MYEYNFETISVNPVSGQIAGQLTRIANQKGQEGWKLIDAFIQYATSGSNHFVYLVFERPQKNRLFRKKRN